MIDMARFIGLRKSEGPPRLIPAAGVAGLPDPAPQADQRKWVLSPVENQLNAEDCTGESAENAHYIVTGGKSGRISPTFSWKVALLREQARTGKWLINQGVQSPDIYDGQVAFGCLLRDARDDSPATNMAPPTPEDMVAAYAYRRSPGDFVPIADADITTCQQFWTWGAQLPDHGIPIEFTMMVDAGYVALNSTNPVWTGPSGAAYGYHRQCTGGYCLIGGKPHVIVVGSWGKFFADGGIAFIPLDVFQRVATDLVASVSGPILPLPGAA